MVSYPRFNCERLSNLIYDGAFVANTLGQQFIAKSYLTEILDGSLIEKALRCPCSSCDAQRSGLRTEKEENIKTWILNSAQRLFALLTYCRCTQLIDGFYHKDHTDERIEWDLRQLTASQIVQSFWQSFSQRDPQGSNRLADQVQCYKYQFFVPNISDQIEQVHHVPTFDPYTILPIVSEKLIDEGGHGRVFEIKIFDEYQRFRPENSSIPLVRKEVDLSDRSVQSEELEILLYVRQLKEDHVVRLVSAYKQNNKIIYIFPRATTNLQRYLRTEPGAFGSQDLPKDPNTIWQQFLAVLRALYRIYADVYHSNSGEKIKLYHFDLKPANILVDLSNGQLRFLVTDFGFSRSYLATNKGDSTKLVGFGGTPAYAPPEIEKLHRQRNHRYDIWSLGCILLEICAFTVNGPSGVKSLDDARYTCVRARGGPSGDNECWDDYFWHLTTDNDVELKPAIVQWMSKLPYSSRITSNASSEFMKDIINLSMDMLNVNVAQRLDAETSQHRLATILKRHVVNSGLTINNEWFPVDDPPGGFLVGSDELKKLTPVNCKYDKFFDNVNLRLYEDFLGVLHLQIWSAKSLEREVELGPRESVSLVSRPGLSTQNRIELNLLLTQNPQLKWVRIYLCNSKDTAILQSVFLGQAVRSFGTASQKCLLLKNLRIKQYRSRFGRKIGAKSNASSLLDRVGRPQAVQFWCEKSYADAEAVERVKPRRGSGRAAIGLLDRRLVIFCEHALLLISFAKNWRLEKPSEKYTGLGHKLIPTDQRKSSRDPSFEVLVLRSDEFGLCQIPLDRKRLEAMQQYAAFECSCLDLDFSSRQDWEVFQLRYQSLKKEWKTNHEILMREQKYAPEDLGYGVST